MKTITTANGIELKSDFSLEIITKRFVNGLETKLYSVNGGGAYVVSVVDGQLHAEPANKIRSRAAIERDLPAGYAAGGSIGKKCSCGRDNCDGNSPYCD